MPTDYFDEEEFVL